MDFRFKPRPEQDRTDVALSLIETYKPYSHNCITIRDLSVYTPENLLPKRSDEIMTTVNTAGKLKVVNNFSEIEITDIYGFDHETFISRPLWYEYTLSKSYINKTKVTQRINKIIDLSQDNRSIERVITSNNKVIIKNSVSIRYRSNTGLTIDYPETAEGTIFHVDYAKGDIKILVNNLGGLPFPGTLIVTYDVIDIDIEIDEPDPSAFLFEIREFDSNTYIVKVYSALNSKNTVKYNTSDAAGNIQQIEEIISYENIFLKVQTFGQSSKDKTFRTDNEDVYIKNGIQLIDYALRQKYLHNTKIYATSPFGLTKQNEWLLRITKNQFTKNGLTYKIKENSDFSTISKISEEPIILDETRIQLSKLPLFQKTKSGIKGIILKNTFDDLYTINSIDETTRIIEINETISAKDIVTAIYYYDDNLIPIKAYDFNPRNKIRNDFNLITRVAVLFILPEEELNSDRSVFVGYLPRYDLSEEITYQDETILSYMTAGNVYPIVEPWVTTQDLHPIALSILTLDNEFLPKISKLKDIRVKGGGIFSGISDRGHPLGDIIFQNFDIGRWDGEYFDTAGIIIFKIPKTIYQSLYDRFITYDEEIVFADSSEKDKLTKNKVESFIREVIQQRKPIGKRALIEYEA